MTVLRNVANIHSCTPQWILSGQSPAWSWNTMFKILSVPPSSGVDVASDTATYPNQEHSLRVWIQCPTYHNGERQLPLVTNSIYTCQRRFHHIQPLWELPISHTNICMFTSSNEWHIFLMLPASLWHLLKDNRAILPCVHSAVCPGQLTFSRVHWSKCEMTSLLLVRTCGTYHIAFAGIHRGGAACHMVPRPKLVDCPQRSKTLWRL